MQGRASTSPTTALGVVLAGGMGRRMGEPKAGVLLAGRPLVRYPLDALREAGLEAVVVAKPDSPLPALDVPVWREPSAPRHPLCGIVHALRTAGRAVVVVGCDMPHVNAGLLGWLAELPDRLVVAQVGGRVHPLPGRYDPRLANPLAHALRRGAALVEAVGELDPRLATEGDLRAFGDPERLVLNVNTAADLRRASVL